MKSKTYSKHILRTEIDVKKIKLEQVLNRLALHIHNDGIMSVSEGNPCQEEIALMKDLALLANHLKTPLQEINQLTTDLCAANIDCLATLREFGDDLYGYEEDYE